jgi:AraC-like DNA-binding protein
LSARIVIDSGKRFTYPRGWDTGPRQRGADILLVPERGALLVSSGDQQWRVSPGQAVWLPRGQPQRIAAAAGAVEFLSIHSLADDHYGLPLVSRPHCGPRHDDAYQYWREGIARLTDHPSAAMALLIHGLQCHWVSWLSLVPDVVSVQENLPKELRLAIQVVGEHPHLGPEEVATASGCTLVTLRRRFLAHLGMTPAKWLSNQRLQRAAYLLRSTDDTVRAIALRAGFSDERYLHQCFHAQYGCTPLSYRHGGA